MAIAEQVMYTYYRVNAFLAKSCPLWWTRSPDASHLPASLPRERWPWTRFSNTNAIHYARSMTDLLFTLFSFQTQELKQLELLCKQLYESGDCEDRVKAEASLVAFSATPDCLSKCRLLLERGDVRARVSLFRRENLGSSIFLFLFAVIICSTTGGDHVNQVGDTNSMQSICSTKAVHSWFHIELLGIPFEVRTVRHPSVGSTLCTYYEDQLVRQRPRRVHLSQCDHPNQTISSGSRKRPRNWY